MRKHKKRLYKKLHKMQFERAIDNLCRSLYDRLVDEYFQDWEYA